MSSEASKGTRPGPFTATVKAARLLSYLPSGTGELWAADVTTSRGEMSSSEFSAVLFIEGPDTANIFGIEFENGLPLGINKVMAMRQQKFINYLREQNVENERIFGVIIRVFDSYRYSSELLTTRAYLRCRQSKLDAGIGYFESTGEYSLAAFDGVEDGNSFDLPR